MEFEYYVSIITIVAAVIAIISLVHGIHVLRWTKQNTKEWRQDTQELFSILSYLIVNSAADPDTVRRMINDYNKSGEMRQQIFRNPDGRYGIAFKPGQPPHSINLP